MSVLDKASAIHGIIPAPLTPMSSDGSAVDFGSYAAYLRFLVEKGVHGLYVAGTSGEGPLLTIDERKKALETALDVVRGSRRDVKVVAQVGCMTTRDTLELAEHAASAGANAVAIVAPWYFVHDERGLVQHFAAAASRVPNTPVFLYNIPGNANSTITPRVAIEAHGIAPNILGVKDSSKDLMQFEKFVLEVSEKVPSFSFLMGTDSLIYPALVLGGKGSVTTVGAVFPEVAVGLYDAFRRGDHEEARKLQYQVTRLRETLKVGPPIMGNKVAIEMRRIPGVSMGGPRAPMRSLTAEETEALKKKLQALGMI